MKQKKLLSLKVRYLTQLLFTISKKVIKNANKVPAKWVLFHSGKVFAIKSLKSYTKLLFFNLRNGIDFINDREVIAICI